MIGLRVGQIALIREAAPRASAIEQYCAPLRCDSDLAIVIVLLPILWPAASEALANAGVGSMCSATIMSVVYL